MGDLLQLLTSPMSGTPDNISAKCTSFKPPTAAYQVRQLPVSNPNDTSTARELRPSWQCYLQTENDSTLLVKRSSPLRTLRGNGRTSRKVSSIGGGSKKLTRNFHPVSEDILYHFCARL
jgi:hypothetical protein